MCKMSGDLVGATESYEKAVALYRDLVGMEHISTATTLHNLAICYKLCAENTNGMDRVSRFCDTP